MKKIVCGNVNCQRGPKKSRKLFEPTKGRVKCCCLECGFAARRQKGAARRMRQCALCHTPFDPANNSVRHCSKDCAYAARATPKDIDRAELEKKISKLTRRQTLWQVVGDRLIEAIGTLPALPMQPPALAPSTELAEEEWALLISDVQAGSRVSSQSTGRLGGFDTKILIEQIEFLKGSLGDILRYHSNRPRTIRVKFLGDMIDGSTIFPGQLRAIEQTAVEQIICVVDQFAGFVAHLSTLFQEVRCYGVIGNHGRLGKKGENDPMDNLDYLAYRWMAERLSGSERVSFDVSESWFQVVQIKGWKFLLVHGDDIPPGTWGIPFYGALRGESRWAKLLKEIQFDYMCMGDKHTPAHFGNVLMNGCWPGGSEFSLKKMMLGGMPTQKLFAVHERFGVTWQRDVMLRSPEAPKVRIYK